MSSMAAPSYRDEDPVAPLRRLLELELLDADRFRGHPQLALAPSPRMYGGSIMAMVTQASATTVVGDRRPHVLNASFLRGADAYDPITIAVERTFDGGSFTTRRVRVEQDGRLIAVMSLGYCLPNDGAVVDAPMPDVPAPHSGFARNPVMEGAASTSPFEFLEFDVTPFGAGAPGDTSRLIWARLRGPLHAPLGAGAGEEERLTSALVAYMSDFGATIAARALVGATVATPGRFASLNHTLWWHRAFDPGQWMLIDFRPVQAAHSRGLVTATLHTEDGTHVASVAQEAMMRLTPL